ncbi:MAG TPA: hypothetical protein PLD54_04830 [Candidatus Levybacteria bacterium]|nr:hypothetical protein [Candidatus Levybacteria bacterium]
MLETILGGALGFSLFSLTSHPNSPVNRRLPQKQVWRLVITAKPN